MKSDYTATTIRQIRKRAMRLKGVRQVRHIYPRAYCVAKSAPGCAVFVTPWTDAEPQIRQKSFSSSHIVRSGVELVHAGDWCSLVYLCTSFGGEFHAFLITV